MMVCSSSHDSSAYSLSSLSQLIKSGGLPAKYHIVLDEAYTCSPQELSPWKGRQLSVEKDAFNYFLSLHRQVVCFLGLLNIIYNEWLVLTWYGDDEGVHI